jgi:hypothetical protein
LDTLPEHIYQDRRRTAIALSLSLVASITDAFSKHGTGWPIVVSFGFFTVLTIAPLTLGKFVDKFSRQESK